MKNGIVVLNFILLVAVGVLFYLYFSSRKKGTTDEKDPGHDYGTQGSLSPNSCRIAYFEMDSVESSFEMSKEWQNELGKKEDRINSEMSRLQNVYQQKYMNLQQHGATMTSAQIDAARNELGQLEQTIKDTKASLDQDYKNYYVQMQQEILSMIRKFCAEYNKDKKYAIIISNEPGLVFYKDSTLDITKDLLKGLNEMYSKNKKPKRGK